MGKEIERKFLVRSEDFKTQATRVYQIKQGYLKHHDPTVRLRLRDQEAFLTIKGQSADDGLSREEWEYSIPLTDAEEMIRLCEHAIIKERYLVPYGEHTWEVDVFHGRHEGLILAELELAHPDAPFASPDWLGQEVTGDIRYYNASLSLNDLPTN